MDTLKKMVGVGGGSQSQSCGCASGGSCSCAPGQCPCPKGAHDENVQSKMATHTQKPTSGDPATMVQGPTENDYQSIGAQCRPALDAIVNIRNAAKEKWDKGNFTQECVNKIGEQVSDWCAKYKDKDGVYCGSLTQHKVPSGQALLADMEHQTLAIKRCMQMKLEGGGAQHHSMGGGLGGKQHGVHHVEAKPLGSTGGALGVGSGGGACCAEGTKKASGHPASSGGSS